METAVRCKTFILPGNERLRKISNEKTKTNNCMFTTGQEMVREKKSSSRSGENQGISLQFGEYLSL